MSYGREKTSDGTYYRAMAKIERTKLGFDPDHNLFTAWIHLDYRDAGHQGAGGRFLAQSVAQTDKDKPRLLKPSITCGAFVMGAIEAAGCGSWEGLVGRTVYALFEHDNWQEPVVGLENLPTEPGRRFLFEECQVGYPTARSDLPYRSSLMPVSTDDLAALESALARFKGNEEWAAQGVVERFRYSLRGAGWKG